METALEHITRFLGICLFAISLGCVGPMTPFGGIDATDSLKKQRLEDTGAQTDPREPTISFLPFRQILHGRSQMAILIKDPNGVPVDHKLMLTYNGMDVTRKFLAHSEMKYSDPEHTQFKIVLRNLRLLPSRENRIHVAYWRRYGEKPVFARYLPPRCSAFEMSTILSTGEFEISPKIIALVTHHATAKNINPTFLAGLIAQESAFDDRAISWAKAIGLTQVTPLGEAQIIRDHASWPRYPHINRLPIPLIQTGIITGRINHRNEWRLDPSLSIQGGLEYISLLNEYWRRPEVYQIVKQNFSDPEEAMSRLILASYNSGPARTLAAVQTLGRSWLDSPELEEAKTYINKVVSYCDCFSQMEAEYADST